MRVVLGGQEVVNFEWKIGHRDESEVRTESI